MTVVTKMQNIQIFSVWKYVGYWVLALDRFNDTIIF